MVNPCCGSCLLQQPETEFLGETRFLRAVPTSGSSTPGGANRRRRPSMWRPSRRGCCAEQQPAECGAAGRHFFDSKRHRRTDNNCLHPWTLSRFTMLQAGFHRPQMRRIWRMTANFTQKLSGLFRQIRDLSKNRSPMPTSPASAVACRSTRWYPAQNSPPSAARPGQYLWSRDRPQSAPWKCRVAPAPRRGCRCD